MFSLTLTKLCRPIPFFVDFGISDTLIPLIQSTTSGSKKVTSRGVVNGIYDISQSKSAIVTYPNRVTETQVTETALLKSVWFHFYAYKL